MNRNRVAIGCVAGFLVLVLLGCGIATIGALAWSIVRVERSPASSGRPVAVEVQPAPEPAVPGPSVISTDEERALIDLYRRVNPGVVNVTVRQVTAPNQLQIPRGGGGSGFVWDKEGHIVTNAHLVAAGEIIDVTFYDNTMVPAEIVAMDPHSDLAVIQVDVPADRLVPLPLGDSDAVVVGQRVAAIGNPFGNQGSMTTGIISAIGRTIPSLTQFSIPTAIQTDAPINPGNSGGPLLNLKGEVIGVNSQIESRDRANSGVGFAVPSNIVRRVVPELLEKGEFVWPWLGVRGTSLTPAMAGANNVSVERGAYVDEVLAGGPAAQAGLRGSSDQTIIRGRPVPLGGDTIIAADGQAIRSFDELILFVSQRQVGDEVTLTVVRDGEEITVVVKLAARPAQINP